MAHIKSIQFDILMYIYIHENITTNKVINDDLKKMDPVPTGT